MSLKTQFVGGFFIHQKLAGGYASFRIQASFLPTGLEWIMAEELQPLLEQIRKEGVEKAEAQAAEAQAVEGFISELKRA